MIYLASPYSHPDANVREQRFKAACRVAAALIRRGNIVFCPIAHSHPMTEFGLPVDWDYWESFDRAYLDVCDELWVLRLKGWKKSKGVQAEIEIVRSMGKVVRYIDEG